MCAREICEKFVYNHSETTEMLKINLIFKKFTKFTGKPLENFLDEECEIFWVSFLYGHKHTGRFSNLH